MASLLSTPILTSPNRMKTSSVLIINSYKTAEDIVAEI